MRQAFRPDGRQDSIQHPLKSAAMTGRSFIPHPMAGAMRTVPSEERPSGRGRRRGGILLRKSGTLPSSGSQRSSGYEFEPPMDHLRNDPYDNQTGEAEYRDRSLAQEEYSTEYEMISLEDITY